MIDWFLNLDNELFFFLNNLHNSWMDTIMWHISGKWQWVPFYVLLLFYIIKTYKKQSVYILIALTCVIICSDFIASGIFKPYFERLRPTHDPRWEGMVHIVNGYKGGRYGFASSHAANTFGLATMIFFIFRSIYRITPYIFLWALVVSYSRIYLGVHYPLDIITGAIIGFFSALVFYFLAKRFINLSEIKTQQKE